MLKHSDHSLRLFNQANQNEDYEQSLSLLDTELSPQDIVFLVVIVANVWDIVPSRPVYSNRSKPNSLLNQQVSTAVFFVRFAICFTEIMLGDQFLILT